MKDGETITDRERARHFYSNMYTSEKDLNSDSQGEKENFESFVEGIEIPQLNTEERDSLDHTRN